MTRKNISEMTYNVSGGTLNLTIPYYATMLAINPIMRACIMQIGVLHEVKLASPMAWFLASCYLLDRVGCALDQINWPRCYSSCSCRLLQRTERKKTCCTCVIVRLTREGLCHPGHIFVLSPSPRNSRLAARKFDDAIS